MSILRSVGVLALALLVGVSVVHAGGMLNDSAQTADGGSDVVPIGMANPAPHGVVARIDGRSNGDGRTYYQVEVVHGAAPQGMASGDVVTMRSGS